MNSSNPVFASLEKRSSYAAEASATKSGIARKTFLLLALTLVSGYFSIFLPVDFLIFALIFSSIIALVAVLVAMFVPRLAMPFSIVYALVQGVFYGTITWLLESMFPGVALTAIVGTASVFIVMFTLYNTGVLRGSELLRKVVLGSLVTFLLGSLIIAIMSLIDPYFLAAFSNNYELAIGISLFLIVLGALMLILDFDRADRVVSMGLEKRAEWQVALGFMVTLIWIYYNILRLAVVVMARNK